MPEDVLETALSLVDAPEDVASRATDLWDAADTLDVDRPDTTSMAATVVLVAARNTDFTVKPSDFGATVESTEVTSHLDTVAGPVQWFVNARDAAVEIAADLDVKNVEDTAVDYLASAASQLSNAPIRPCAGAAVLVAARTAGESISQRDVTDAADCSAPTLREYRNSIAPGEVVDRGPTDGVPNSDEVVESLAHIHSSFEAFTDVVLDDARCLIHAHGLDWAERRSPRVAAAALYYAAAHDRDVAPSQKRVADAAGCSRPSVTRAYSSLNDVRGD